MRNLPHILGLMLSITIHRYQHIESVLQCKVKRRLQRCAITKIRNVRLHAKPGELLQNFTRPVVRTVIDDENLIDMLTQFVQHPGDVGDLVVDR